MTKVIKTLAVTCGASVYGAYSTFWLGWFSYRSTPPWLHVRDTRQLAMLTALALPLILPFIVWLMSRRFGSKHTVFALLPVTALALLAYVAAAYRYYYSTDRFFDPFVQTPAIRPRIPREKSSRYRILTLGGSTTFDDRKRVQFSYPWKLERSLKDRDHDLKLEVINGGRSWYTTRHSLINYTTYYRQWKPDLVIIMHAINDLYRSFSPSRYAHGPYSDLYRHFYGPSIDGARPPAFEEFLIWNKLRPAGLEWFGDLRVHEVDMPLDRFYSLDAFQRNLAALIHYIHSDGSQVMLMSQPFLYRDELSEQESAVLWLNRVFCVDEKSWLHHEIPSSKSMVRAMEAFNNATRNVAEQNNAFFFDASALIQKNLQMFEDEVHYTDAGSTRLAEIAGDRLVELGLLRH